MCEFTQREYSCGHFKFIAARWCNLYKRTHRRCQPDIAHFEYRADEICGQCRPQEVPAWQHLIRSNAPISITGITGINSLDDCCRDLDLVPWLGADRPGSCTRRPPTTCRPGSMTPLSLSSRSGSGMGVPVSASSPSLPSSSASSSTASSSKASKTTSGTATTFGSNTVLSGKIRRHSNRASVTLRQ
ncbi:uncharacterized protein SPSK_09825 [Sporothrix schenckii 1099-18]|uniref:Uncharacterized protein n=2 Tax=Sporothrix schenckii TaxID=29908 RepID=U7Q9J0_SPOS1|nr:uncharacterized protein SPSK_09825 [Sporothrix schenckii 1099-18]ERT03421.1 hypothetical protein HMPREF1624_01736 [Sporothrix schenckii ATCC 58251]KJR84129.1 hypothetical protein SPSK_09825 [Sporothrix schenckii 1099-18]